MFDERGLYLLVRKSGSKLWRLKYRFAGKEKTLSIGPCPDVPISKARQARDKALQQLREGIDPSAEKQQRKAQAIADALDSFEKVARAWYEVKKTLAPRYAAAILSRLENNVFPAFGSKSIRAITPPVVLDMIRGMEKRPANDMAHRVRNRVSDVFVWAIASGLAETDPAAIIRKALVPTDPQLRPAMVKITAARKRRGRDRWSARPHYDHLLSFSALGPIPNMGSPFIPMYCSLRRPEPRRERAGLGHFDRSPALCRTAGFIRSRHPVSARSAQDIARRSGPQDDCPVSQIGSLASCRSATAPEVGVDGVKGSS